MRTRRDALREKEPLRYKDGHLEGPDWIHTKLLTALFQVRRETIWHWRREQGFPLPYGIGSTTRYMREDVEHWIRINEHVMEREK